MPRPVLRIRLTFAALLLMGTASIALADPPGRVGRISYVEGQVSLHTGDQNQWAEASVNFPVITGDGLWTGPHSRTEIQVGSADVRMDEQTEIDMVRLDDQGTQIRVDQGAVNVHLAYVPPGGVQILTAAGQVDLLNSGDYHVDAEAPPQDGHSGRVEIGVLEGEARLVNGSQAVDLQPGEGAVISPEQGTLTTVEAEPTDIDDWALSRERREGRPVATQYVSPEMTGYQDLDGYGRWTTQPQYGAVWVPTTVGPGWAPYRFGHWAYVAPWGWTWVDDAPWGFAPFHYGRWVNLDGQWGWCPGRRVERPVYAPALVAFVGSPVTTTMTITVGNQPMPAVGWVPLAPHEVFHPYYPVSQTYIRQVNITHVTNVTNVTVNNVQVANYANAHAATVVPAAAFTGSQPVHRAALPVQPQQIQQAAITTAIARLQPAGHQPPAGSPPVMQRPPAHAGAPAFQPPHVAPPMRPGSNLPAMPQTVQPMPQHPVPAPQAIHPVSPMPVQAQPAAVVHPPVVHAPPPWHQPAPAAPSRPTPPPARPQQWQAPQPPQAQPRSQWPQPWQRQQPQMGRPQPPQPQAQHPQAMPVPVPHPVQQSVPMPTPHGWVRMPPQGPQPQHGQPQGHPQPQHEQPHGNGNPHPNEGQDRR